MLSYKKTTGSSYTKCLQVFLHESQVVRNGRPDHRVKKRYSDGITETLAHILV